VLFDMPISWVKPPEGGGEEEEWDIVPLVPNIWEKEGALKSLT
jgi:hypothetical protein